MKRNINKNKKISMLPMLIVVFGFIFFITLGYKTSLESNIEKPTQLNTSMNIQNNVLEKHNDDEIIEILTPEFNNNAIDINADLDNNVILNEELILNDDSEKNILIKRSDIYVNKVIVAKNIDNDKTSENYRNPIDAYKTISTLDQSVIKEINYQPSFFIWSSINTEEKTFINQSGEFEPLKINMVVKCNDIIIEELEYNITANTPRWREWIEIDVTNLSSNSLNQVWNVEIIDLKNDMILESRNFKLLNDNQILSMSNEIKK